MTEEANRHLVPALLIEFLENSLDSQAMTAARTHLEHCGECRAELAMARSFQEQNDESRQPASRSSRRRRRRKFD